MNFRDLSPNALAVTFGSFKSVDMERTSIHNVPDEILIMMIKIVLLDYERDATFNAIFCDARSRVKSVAVLLTLSRVCKAWKTTILAYPAFWTRADGYHGELLTRIIARAGALPLSLFVTSETEGLLGLLASHGSRIKRLDMTICEDAADVGYLAFVDGRPLECFTLNYERVYMGLQRVSPFVIFDEPVVPLKALSISPFSGFFPSNHFPNLTHLRLVLRFARSMDRDSQRLSLSFFDLLSHTPMLEFLTVAGIDQPLEGFTAKPDTPVVLAYLRSIVFMHGGMKWISTVLARLSVPQTALVRLERVYAPTPSVPPLPQVSAVRSTRRLNIATENACLQLIAEGASSGLWVHANIADKIEDENELADDAWSWQGWLSTLPDFIPLAQVTKLELYVGRHHAIPSTLLSHMVGMVELSIRLNRHDEQRRGDPDVSLIRLLYRILAESTPLLCPELQVFNIDVDGTSPEIVPDLYPEELKRMILFRSGTGHPLDCITIQPFADMRMVQADVYWDVASRFDTLRTAVTNVEVRSPGIPAMPFDRDPTWSKRWFVEGADKYWEMEWDEIVRYTPPWSS